MINITNDDGSLNEFGWTIITIFIACLIGVVIIGLFIKVESDQMQQILSDPEIAFLYQDNNIAAIALGCAVSHDQKKDRLTTSSGKYYKTSGDYYYYNSDAVFDDMQNCMGKAGIVFRYSTNQEKVPVDVLHAIFKRCTASELLGTWFHNLNYNQNALACMIKNGLIIKP